MPEPMAEAPVLTVCRCCDQPMELPAGVVVLRPRCARCLVEYHRHTWVPKPTWEQLEARAALLRRQANNPSPNANY